MTTLRGMKGQFSKGAHPLCPVLPGQHLSPATEFQKGQQPHNQMPIGSITIREDRDNPPRRWIKVAEPNKWLLYAQWVWLEAGGNIPKGFLIHHLDGEELHDEITNLALVTKGTHLIVHRADLQAGKEGIVLTLKNIRCTKCGSVFQGKYQRKDSRCDECLRETRRLWASRNGKRVLSTH